MRGEVKSKWYVMSVSTKTCLHERR